MSDRLTPAREAEIRNRRLDEVTPVPWLVSEDQDGRPVIYVERTSPEGKVYASVLLVGDCASEADVQFVASARRSVPELLAELDAVRKERDELQKRLHDAAMTRTWRNEDGKKFVFVEDIKPALLGTKPGTGASR